MSCTLISNFEQVFPGNDRVQGGFLLFLTLNISFGREGKRLLSPTTLSLTYVRESGIRVVGTWKQASNDMYRRRASETLACCLHNSLYEDNHAQQPIRRSMTRTPNDDASQSRLSNNCPSSPAGHPLPPFQPPSPFFFI